MVGWLAEVLAELIDVPGVGVDSAVGKVADLHVFGHALDVRVHATLVRDPIECSLVLGKQMTEWKQPQ